MSREAYELVRSFKLDRELDELWEWMAREKRTSKSEIVRRALLEYYRNHFNNSKPFITRRIKIY